VRGYAETRHRAKSWDRKRRAIAHIEAPQLGLDIRFVVTNLSHGAPQWLYDRLYCARGQAETLIELHETQLCSDRTSCPSALADQLRLVLHTAAYRLMLGVRDARATSPRPISRLYACDCRRSPRAWSRPRAASPSPSPPPAPRAISSAPCRPRCS
jgi:hypothetical protein